MSLSYIKESARVDPHKALDNVRRRRKERQERAHVPKEVAPMAHILGKDRVTTEPYNRQKAEVAEHELFHAKAAHRYGRIGWKQIDLTVEPEGNTLGMVRIGGQVDVVSLQVCAMASQNPTSYGEARGTGSDEMTAWYLYHQHGGIHPDEAAARGRAAVAGDAHITRASAIVISHMNEQLGMKVVPGELLPLVDAQAEYELKHEERDRVEDEQDEPDRMDTNTYTEIHYFENDPYVYEVVYVTDGQAEAGIMVCGVCLHQNGHTEWCSTIRHNDEHVVELGSRIRDVIMSNPSAELEDIYQAGRELADQVIAEEAKQQIDQLDGEQLPKKHTGFPPTKYSSNIIRHPERSEGSS